MDRFLIWFNDKRSILDTMISNLMADLSVGYDYFGNSARKQRAEIEAYKAKFDAELTKLGNMQHDEVLRWCRRDLKRRGAIS